MRIFGLFLFVLLLPFFVATSVAAKAPVPPSLVPCKSEASCERSPEKLEGFVREFFSWYNGVGIKCAQLFSGERRRLCEDKKGEILLRSLTNSFFENLQKIGEETDADPILCAQDIWEDQNTLPVIRKINIQKDKADLVVFLPFYFSPEDTSSQTLDVMLRPEGGFWRVAKIQRTPDRIPSK